MGAFIVHGTPERQGCMPDKGVIANALGVSHIVTARTNKEVRDALSLLDPVIFTGIDPTYLRGLSDRDGRAVRLLTWLEALERVPPARPEFAPPQSDAERHGQEADFWIIWSPEGERPPSFRHHSRDSADREADRLALANPGCRFFVMEPRLEVTASRPVRIEYWTPDGVPF